MIIVPTLPAARRPLTLLGVNVSNYGDTQVAIPTHSAGDLIVLYAVNIGGTAALAVPASGGTVPTWTDIVNSGATDVASQGFPRRMVYTVASTDTTTTGVWSNAKYVYAAVISGQKSAPIGGAASSGETKETASTWPVTCPAVTMTDTSGKSMLLHFAFAMSYSYLGEWSGTPSGYTIRHSRTEDNGGMHTRVLTKDVTTSDGVVTAGQVTNSAPNSFVTACASVEILAP